MTILKSFLFIVLMFFLLTVSYGYDINKYLFTQGFLNIQKTNKGLNFVCNKQCILGLGYLKNNKKILINGNFSGNGKGILVYVIGKQVIPFKQFNLDNIQNPIFLINNSIYKKLPKENTVIGIIFNGNIKGQDIKFDLSNLTLSEQLLLAWKNFTFMEGITPYIINLKYGFKIFNIQAERILTILGLVFILFLILLGFYKNKKVLDIIVYVLIVLTLIISLKNLYEYYEDTKENITNFGSGKKVFYLNDYYNFIKNIRNYINFKNNCTYNFISFRSWPFKKWAKTVYLKPCVFDTNNPDYIIIYHSNIPGKYQDCKKVYQNGNNLLLKCK